ncbi:MAG: S9 family peptidase [Candidatus Hodarchaeota archaeon]
MPIPIEEIIKVPIITFTINMDHEGKKVVYSSNRSGLNQLYIVETKPNVTPTQITQEETEVRYGELSPNGKELIYLLDQGGNETYQLILVDLEKYATRQITKQAYLTWGGTWHPTKRIFARNFTTKEQSGIEIINLTNDENYVLTYTPIPTFFPKYSHTGKWLACTGWGGKDPKNQQVMLLNCEQPDDTIIYSFKEGSRESGAVWSPDDKYLAFQSDLQGDSRVVIQQFQGEECTFLPLEDEEEVPEESALHWSPKEKGVLYLVSKHGQTQLYKHVLGQEKERIPFPRGTIRNAAYSADAKRIAVIHSSFSSPDGVYYIADGSEPITLSSREFSFNKEELVAPQSIWYESYDGRKIHGWYLQPASGTAPHPAIVFPHGGPWAQVSDEFLMITQSLAQLGFGVLLPNYRGSTGYGKAFKELILGDPGGGELEDVVYSAKWLRKRADIDPTKIAVMGGSYGGYLTLLALTKKPTAFNTGVAMYPVADCLEGYQYMDTIMRQFDHELFGGPPTEKEELYRERSPSNHIENIQAPVMIIAGRNDIRCPFPPVEKFVNKLKEMNHPYTLMVDEDEGHLGMVHLKIIREINAAVEFLTQVFQLRK